MHEGNDCSLCPKLVACRSQIVHPTTVAPGRILCVGEAPGRMEDEAGRGFVGRAGQTLHRHMVEHGMQLGLDYGLANVVRCWPSSGTTNRKPTREEIDNCLPKLLAYMNAVKPRLLLLVGSVPSQSLLGGSSLSSVIAEAKGRDWGAPVGVDDASPLVNEFWKRQDFIEHVFPVPHTSPLAFNRVAPNGERWKDVFLSGLAVLSARYKGYRNDHVISRKQNSFWYDC